MIPEPEDLLQGNFSGFARTKPEKEGRRKSGCSPALSFERAGFFVLNCYV